MKKRKTVKVKKMAKVAAKRKIKITAKHHNFRVGGKFAKKPTMPTATSPAAKADPNPVQTLSEQPAARSSTMPIQPGVMEAAFGKSEEQPQ